MTSYDADEIVTRMRADTESDWPSRLLHRIAEAPLVPEEWLDPAPADTLRLTPPVARVLQAASYGLTNDMIAATLGVSVETVKTQLKQAQAALGGKNRTHSCCQALREGLIQ